LNWAGFYSVLEADPRLLKDPAIVRLLEDRLQEIGEMQRELEDEAMHCEKLLEQVHGPDHDVEQRS
jgi:hypothetical protein